MNDAPLAGGILSHGSKSSLRAANALPAKPHPDIMWREGVESLNQLALFFYCHLWKEWQVNRYWLLLTYILENSGFRPAFILNKETDIPVFCCMKAITCSHIKEFAFKAPHHQGGSQDSANKGKERSRILHPYQHECTVGNDHPWLVMLSWCHPDWGPAHFLKRPQRFSASVPKTRSLELALSLTWYRP